MTQEAAKAIHENGDDLNFRDNYSGRGMYGKTTHAISGDPGEIETAKARALRDESVPEEVKDEIEKGFASDNMGLGMIIY